MQDQAEIARALETLRLTAPKTTPPETAATIPDEQTPDTAAHANSSGSIKNISLISQRTSDNATLATDELPGERQGAAGVIAIHNHPSGNIRPSRADRELTKNLQWAGKMLDCPLLDHLIVSRTTVCSLAAAGCALCAYGLRMSTVV